MKIINCVTTLIFFSSSFFVSAQSTLLPQGSKEYHFIDRLEIKHQQNTDLNFSTIKPYNRKAIVRQAEFLDSAGLHLSKVDRYNLNSLLMNNSEWVTKSNDDLISKKPILKRFYKTPANLYEVDVKDFFLVINPVLQFTYGKERGNNESIFLNSRGLTARGMIAKRLGFSATVTENQERGPQFFKDRVTQLRALPGAAFYKSFKNTAYDYFDARGYITFNAAKYIDFQFGHDKNFIGNGYRSLFLSDDGAGYLFLKINTRLWKFNYQNIFAELMPQFKKNGDVLLDRKYAAIHHLSMNVTKWLNVGVFESVIFGRKNHFDFQYLNPIIFYRHIEGAIGSPDNAVAGLDVKANFAKRLQVYGQLLLDEFQLSELRKNRGYWANKFGIQAGLKYIDVFGISNLDMQLETNRARPFTYSHIDSVANYTHYNQPLAHPLGANFQEYIGILKYQPIPKLYFNARLMYYKQGLDSMGRNFGASPFEDYTTRPRNFGFEIGSGNTAKSLNATFLVSYEVRQNLFLEASALYRNFKTEDIPSQNKTTQISAGLRWNIFRREYDY